MNGIRPTLRLSFVCICLLLGSSAFGRAQSAGTGALTGIVTDSSGAVVPGVKAPPLPSRLFLLTEQEFPALVSVLVPEVQPLRAFVLPGQQAHPDP